MYAFSGYVSYAASPASSWRASRFLIIFRMADDDDPNYNDDYDDNSSQASFSDEENRQAVDDGSSDEENNVVVSNVSRETVDLGKRLMKANPLTKAYRKVKTKKRTPEEIAAFKMEVEQYLIDLFSLPFCFARFQDRFVMCRCLQLDRERCSFSALAARLGEFIFSFLFYVY